MAHCSVIFGELIVNTIKLRPFGWDQSVVYYSIKIARKKHNLIIQAASTHRRAEIFGMWICHIYS